MNGKSTVWIVLCLLSAGAAGTGFFLNSQNSRQVKEQQLEIQEITDTLVRSRTENRAIEEEVQTLKSTIAQQQSRELVPDQLEAKDKEIDSLKEQLSSKEAELTALTEQVAVIRQQQDALTPLTQQLEEKDSKLREALAQQQQFEQRQAELARDAQAKTDEIQALTAQLDTLAQVQAERDQLAEQLAMQQAAAASVSPDMSVDERVLDLSQKIIALEASQQEKDAVITRQDARVQALTEQLAAGQQDLEDKITALTSAIQSSQTTGSNVGASELEQKLQELAQKLETTNQGLSAQEELAEVRARLSAKDVQDARLTSQFEALTAERDQLQAQIAKQEQQLGQKDSVAQDLTLRLEQLTREVLPAEGLDQKKIAELTRQIAELTRQIADITRQITSQESQKERLQEQIASITQQLENAIQEKDGLLVDLMKQRESEKKATEAEKEKLQQQILVLEANINAKDSDISDFKAQLDEKEAALLQLQSTFEADVAAREEKIASLEQALKEMDAKYRELTEQYALQDRALAALGTEIQALEEQKNAAEKSAATLQEESGKLAQQLNEAQTKAAMLEENLAEREAEYQQKIAEHNQMIAQLKDDIDNENMEKATIRERLQTELERSESDYQERLKQLATEKEQEIKTLQTMAETYEQMTQTLSQEIDSKDIEISQYKEQLTVKIVDRIVFSSGRVAINAEGREVLNTVGEFLKQNLEGRQIQVNGHTDNVPIGLAMQDKYPTNWELSTVRAVNVVRYLRDYADIPAEKLSAVGRGEYYPIADNDTPEGRALNRRIEIVLIPELPIGE